MNAKIITVAVALCGCSVLGQTNKVFSTNKMPAPSTESRVPFSKLTPEEQQKRIEARMKKAGGIVERPGTGVVIVVNFQTAVSEQGVKELFMLSSSCPVKIPFKCVSGGNEPFAIPKATAIVTEAGAQAGVFLVDDHNLPMSLCAMEAGWGVVNVAPLKADNPTKQRLYQRLNKLFTRVCTVVFGGANEVVPFSAMQSVTSIKELDEMGAFAIAPNGLSMISDHMPKIGVTFPYMTTYRRACREGWAPAPTNDIQKAIWDKVHATPKNPIKIEFDPKKGR